MYTSWTSLPWPHIFHVYLLRTTTHSLLRIIISRFSHSLLSYNYTIEPHNSSLPQFHRQIGRCIMPESGAKSDHFNNGKGVHLHQSAWLTHWTGMKSESNSKTLDHLSQLSKSEREDRDIKKQLGGVEAAYDIFGFSKDIKDADLTMSLKKATSQSFPFFKRGQEQGPQVSHERLTSGLNVETSSKECHLQATEQVKYHMFFGESSSQPPSDDGAYKLDDHTTHGLENFRHITAAFSPKDHLNKSEKSQLPSFLRQHNPALLKGDPSTSSQRSPALMEEQYQRMQKHIGMGFFPNQTCSPQNTKSQTVFSYQNVPHFVHDAEMARMTGGLHSFSRTTHSLLITKQTDVKVYHESQIYRESRVPTQLKGESIRELNCIPPHFSQGQQGLKIQLLDSSDHESPENVEDVKAQKNESSADTDAMDMEAFMKNHTSGVRLSQTNKDIMESNIPLLPSITLSTEKDTRRKRKIELPDINLEISALPAASSSADKADPCTSITQSLDMNTLHFNLDRTSNSRSDECSNGNPDLEPGNRWIKRLKLNTSNSLAIGTKISKLVEPSSHKCHGKKSESLIGESASVEAKRECKDITLSHSWIQRWRHNQNQKNVETVETCKPGNSKFAKEEFQKKQFPSIAAMALMGKVMTGFQQCKFQKKESFVVWNTKAFEE